MNRLHLTVALIGWSCTSTKNDPAASNTDDERSDTAADTAADTASDDDTSTSDGDSGSDTSSSSPRFNEPVYKATHNSYSGGERGTIREQLSAGVRLIELDFHDNGFGSGGYQIGHDSPGDEVDTSSTNPNNDNLTDWLADIASWSNDHSGHAPITVLLDSKDDLADNYSFADGNLEYLNKLLEETFGSRLHVAEDQGAQWDTIEEMVGQFVVVLSGASNTRRHYRWDEGHNPAVDMNDHGQVVEVHDSGSGRLWYWTGQRQGNGSVTWYRHGRFDTGEKPAVAINNEGLIVEVHESEDRDTLWYHVGWLDSDYEITWSDSHEYDDGVEPTIRFDDRDGRSLREIHVSENHADQNWYWDLTLDSSGWELEKGDHERTDEPLWDKSDTTTGGHSLSVWTGLDSPAGADTLLYGTDALSQDRIRYRQLLFMDYIEGEDDSDLFDDDSWFVGVESGNAARAAEWREEYGGLSRVWSFSESDIFDTVAAPTFPATDTPFANWYIDFCNEVGTIE